MLLKDEIKRNILNDNRDKPILKVSAYDVGISTEEDVKTEADKEIIAGKYTVQSYKLRDKARPFIDFMHMTTTGGHGGDGCVAFLREKGRSQEPPSGGNGGRGGNVIFIASPSHSSLHSISRSITAGSGESGRGNMRHGAAGKDIILPIPLVSHGGEGGKGNPHFATNVNRSPTYASKGKPGEIRYLELEVKTIADVGLVGLPNAGKSTFLTAVSNAHPKIASYPFTTLNPYIGTVDYFDKYQITIADIPGLIKGAHKNIGLGHSFLRHVERSKVLVYVIDLVTNEPWEDWKTLINELEQYNEGLTRRPSLIVANKADVTEKAKKNLKLLETEVAYIRGEQEKDWIAKESIKIFKNYDLEDSHFKGFNPDYNPKGRDLNDYKDNENEEDNEDEFHIIPISAKYQKNIVKVTTILRQMKSLGQTDSSSFNYLDLLKSN
ncbi:11857_t:CDS:2 [Diversispora eburnea]|uniref:11857_t:CDS:1 n=1 Tax=Diversispora eburnea TaxID=1213867 RepID=A0A9N8YQZ8_9GLOM|nr:11857_t:CDS:2 [Diversispora eburnea]